jgi:hypothetical protein
MVVAAGPQLFPDLITPLMQIPEHGLWLLPTPQFGRQGVAAADADGNRSLAGTIDMVAERLESLPGGLIRAGDGGQRVR